MIHRFAPKPDEIYSSGSLVRVNGTWHKITEIMSVFCGRHGEMVVQAQCFPVADPRVPLREVVK